MEKILGTIMEQTRDNELRVKMLHSMIRKQRKWNKQTNFVEFIIWIYIIVTELRYASQQETNKELRKELDELKKMKGE